ncbi:MAG TPA: VCBS repeat-containing protein [Gemmatimonadaceae bacterium]|nr:VCBS repeat-containing protein [Gemmatimonadaceae bacterium]
MPEITAWAFRAHHRCAAIFFATLLSVSACTRRSEPPVFKLLSPKETGIDFANTINATDSFNVQTDVYIYNGAGVAVGDIDNDGLPDIFFSGNMVSSRLYLNRGSMHFADITTAAGVGTKRWATGASMVDINGDGLLDVYVSVSGPEKTKAEDRANLLFVNNGNRTFTEAAAKYGIADTGFTTHAAFLDYDRDGCLDLFLLNNSPKDFTRGVASHPIAGRDSTPGSFNQLYHNDCPGGKPGHFTNVSAKAGILHDSGYGLGVAIGDLNGDGWPDIYVSNDGMPNDVLYLNDRNGTFRNVAARSLKHTSQAGMGVDIADFNDDGYPDILQVDMLPSDLQRRKKTNGNSTMSSLVEAQRRGYRIDYSQNALQLNNGITAEGLPLFSEISRLAGVSATDWSWSPLFADFDNDGHKDIFIGNGYPKAVNDLDYMAPAFSAMRSGKTAAARRMLRELPAYEFASFAFRSNGDLTFSDKTKSWGLEQPALSYGAAYADLNNDGRLDLVVSNINGPAFVYENVLPRDEAHHYLEVQLDGEGPRSRTAAIGAQIVVTAGGTRQYYYDSPFRGYMSSVDQRIHIGLGKATRVDTLEITWPDGTEQVLTNVRADQLLRVKKAGVASIRSGPERSAPLWFEPAYLAGLAYRQASASNAGFSVQPLLPYVISAHGPAIAVGDVNADGLDDIFIGGGEGVPGKLFIQQANGSFHESNDQQPWEADKAYDDWSAVFVDANGDGRPDLYVASGGYTQTENSPHLQDRLYINEGNGRFVRDPHALPQMLSSKSVVRVGDFNRDGRPDLFVGGRLTPRKYPYPTRSYILRNDGGHFTDVTQDVAPALINPGGMVTDAAWVDFDGDGRLDLVTVGEWMPIQFLKNEEHRFVDVTKSTGLPPTRGWWYTIATGDFDNDGRPDLVAGNLGLNDTYQTSKDTTFEVYAGSFTGNQATDVVLAENINGTSYPLGGLAPIGQTIYTAAIRFPTFGSFAGASLNQLFGSEQLKQALHYSVDTFASIALHNEGGGKFTMTRLPNLAQLSPIKSFIVHDVDGDGNLDLILAGNLYSTEPNTPRADAGNGLWLRGNGRGGFVPIPPYQSGFLAPLDVSGLAILKTVAGPAIIVANVADSLYVVRIRSP